MGSLVDEIEAMSFDEPSGDESGGEVRPEAAITLECDKCGSTDIEVDGDIGVCRRCGTKLVIKSDKPIVNVTKKEIHVHNEGTNKSDAKSV